MRGKKGARHLDPDDPPRRRANKQPGHGTYDNDRPPVFTVKGRQSGKLRCFVREGSGTGSCLEVLAECVGASTSVVNTDEWSGYARVESNTGITHRTVRHGYDADGRREWARDDDGDGIREVHCNGCEGAGTGLRTFLRVFRGVHKEHLAEYVATFETMTNAKRITGEVLRRMCFVGHSAQPERT